MRRIYILVGVLTFIVFLAAMAPASLLVMLADDDLKSVSGLRLGTSDGTVWQGNIEFKYRDLPTSQLTWNLHILPLLTGRMTADVEITGDGLSATLITSATSSETRISELTALVQGYYINPVTVPYGLDLSGSFSLAAPIISLGQGWLSELDGKLNWTGGIVHIETPQQFYSVKLPPLTGDLSMIGQIAQLVIAEDDTRLLNIDIKPDGWALVAVDYALFDLTGMSIPGASPGQAGPAFMLEEKLF